MKEIGMGLILFVQMFFMILLYKPPNLPHNQEDILPMKSLTIQDLSLSEDRKELAYNIVLKNDETPFNLTSYQTVIKLDNLNNYVGEFQQITPTGVSSDIGSGEKLIDGFGSDNDHGRWTNSGVGAHWFTIDYGTKKFISSMDIEIFRSKEGYFYDYEFYTGDINNLVLIKNYDGVANGEQWSKHDLNVHARYITVKIVGAGSPSTINDGKGNSWTDIWEVKSFGYDTVNGVSLNDISLTMVPGSSQLNNFPQIVKIVSDSLLGLAAVSGPSPAQDIKADEELILGSFVFRNEKGFDSIPILVLDNDPGIGTLITGSAFSNITSDFEFKSVEMPVDNNIIPIQGILFSSPEGEYALSSMIDGKSDTYFATQIFPSEFVFSFNKAYDMQSSIIHFNHSDLGRVYTYKLHYSMGEGLEYKEIVSADSGGVTINDLRGIVAKKIKLTVLSNNQANNWINIIETNFYGTEAVGIVDPNPDPNPDPDPVIDIGSTDKLVMKNTESYLLYVKALTDNDFIGETDGPITFDLNDNDAIINMDFNDPNAVILNPTGIPGTAILNISADVDMGDSINNLTHKLDIEVVPGKASKLSVSFVKVV